MSWVQACTNGGSLRKGRRKFRKEEEGLADKEDVGCTAGQGAACVQDFPVLWVASAFSLCVAFVFLSYCVCSVVMSVTWKELENVGLDVPWALVDWGRGNRQGL